MDKEPPVRVYAKPYRGSDPKKRAKFQLENEAAVRLERYLAEKHVPGQPQSLTYFDIARETGIRQDLVKELLFRARGGSNGITF